MATNTEASVNPHNIVHISEADDSAGATIWWRLRGDVDRQQLSVELDKRWLKNQRPDPHSPEVAIRRAASVLTGKRRFLRSIKKGLWALVEEAVEVSGDALKHWQGPTVTINKIGQPVVKNATQEEVDDVVKSYEYHLDALTTEDVSSWLIGQAERLGAVALRTGGGIYYLPPKAMKEWADVVASVHAASEGRHTVYKVPSVRMTTDGARAILDSLKEELEKKIGAIKGDLDGGQFGVVGLENRADTARDMLAKVGEYEALLGSPLEDLREALAELQAQVAASILAAESSEEAS